MTSISSCALKSLLFGTGSVLLVSGVIMAAVWPLIFKTLLTTQLSLSKGSHTFDMWVETPLPMYLDIYLFNWTNVEESLHHDATPHVQQMGPYVFSEKHTKVDLNWRNDDTVSYRQYRKWIFHPELSNGTLSDNITNFNVVAVTIGTLCKNLNKIEKFLVNEALEVRVERLVVTKNVSELLFEGFHDPILDSLDIFKKYKINIPIPFDKFGWFYKRNMSRTADGLFTMETGGDDISKVGDVVSWNNQTTQAFYSGECAKVQGSLGELWSPSTYSKDSIRLFAPDICSWLDFKASGTLSMYDLSGKVFSGNEEVFDNGRTSPKTGCYCVAGKKCPLYGVRDVSPCRGGAPVSISFPHFYLADPSYRKAVDGLEPVAEKHAFHMALEENTGVPLRVNARLQINLVTEPDKHIKFFSKMPNVYMPMIWFDQHAVVTKSIASDLKSLSLLATYGIWALVGVASVGALLLGLGVFLTWKKYWNDRVQPTPSEVLLVTGNN